MRAFHKVRGKGASDQSHQITVTFSPELSKLIAAEKERSGKTAEEIAEYAVRLHCAEMATRIFEVKP
jgi:hypothetical protein